MTWGPRVHGQCKPSIHPSTNKTRMIGRESTIAQIMHVVIVIVRIDQCFHKTYRSLNSKAVVDLCKPIVSCLSSQILLRDLGLLVEKK